MNSIIEYLQDNNISFEQNVDLRKKTWIHRGGKCDLFILPESAEQLELLVQHLYVVDISFLLAGHTSNLYIHNDANIPVVVSTHRCNNCEFREEEIYCEGGVGVIKLAKECVQKGISGFEYLTGLPGTVAGALYNNSSCKKNSISELLIDLRFVRKDGEVITLTPEDLEYKFRTSILKEKRLEGTIVSCRLKLKRDNAETLQKIADENSEERKQILEGPSQNLGCTVNRCFINGPMPKRYAIPLTIYGKILSFFNLSIDRNKELKKKFILRLSGYSQLIPYISNRQMIIFVWKDEGADVVYPKYLEFMKKVYKTDKVEIEEIANG